MLVTPRSRLQIRTQNIAFVILFLAMIGLLATLSGRYVYQADWTAGNRNTLSESSIKLLEVISEPIGITAYVTEDEPVRRRINELIRRYQRYKPDIDLTFINPDTEPEVARQLRITVNGELIIAFAGRKEHLKQLSEQSITNALQRIVRSQERWIVFLQGHGERDPHGQANHDLQAWVNQLEDKGLKIHSINLVETPRIPANATVLVIAGPQVDILPGEVKLIEEFIADGGNLLWLTDPGPMHGLDPLAETLGLEFSPGMIVDPTSQLFGINDPRFAIVPNYPFHAITQNFNMLTLFPQAVAIELEEPEGWHSMQLLETVDRSWSETNADMSNINFDKGSDIPGPLTVGVVLSRELTASENDAKGSNQQLGEETEMEPSGEQRVVIVGDGDFLSNAYLGNGGNLDLGMNMINWLSHDDSFIAIPAKMAPDINLELSRTAQIIISFGFLLVLPMVLAGSGLYIWLVRRKR